MKNLMKPNNGEAAVTIVRMKPSFAAKTVDFADYTNPRITAVIPCWKDNSGTYRAVADGKTVKKGSYDEERKIMRGTAFRYPDGEEIVFTRNAQGEEFFVPKECTTCVMHNAFGK